MLLLGTGCLILCKDGSFAPDSAGDLRTSPVALSEECSDVLTGKMLLIGKVLVLKNRMWVNGRIAL
jgi:hypothetical protein